MRIKVKLLDSRAELPKRASAFAAGADLRALDGADIAPGQTVFIKTGIALEIPQGYAGLVYARSGLSCKGGLAPANKVGVIDSDYRGEVTVALLNHGKETQKIEAGERVAQLVITPVLPAEYELADELEDTVRGKGGFGSTGR